MLLCITRYRGNASSIPVHLCGKQMGPLSLDTPRSIGSLESCSQPYWKLQMKIWGWEART